MASAIARSSDFSVGFSTRTRLPRRWTACRLLRRCSSDSATRWSRHFVSRSASAASAAPPRASVSAASGEPASASAAAARILPQAARALTQLACGRIPLVGDDRFERRGQVVQLPLTVGSRGKVVAPLVRVTGSGVESRVQIARGGMIDGIQGIPLRDDGGLRLDGRVGGESLQPRDEHAAHSKRGLERVGSAVRGLARGPCL